MTSDLNELMVIYPERLWLEISDQAQEKAWRLSKQSLILIQMLVGMPT